MKNKRNTIPNTLLLVVVEVLLVGVVLSIIIIRTSIITQSVCVKFVIKKLLGIFGGRWGPALQGQTHAVSLQHESKKPC